MATCDHVTWCRWLYLEYLIVCIVGSLSQRPCSNNNRFIESSSYFLGKDTDAYPAQYGDCSFSQSLCNYTQSCTDLAAEDWRQTGDHAECPGKTGLFDSFSVLLSPLLLISHVTCLTFEFTQEAPGKLSVYLATPILFCSVMPEEVQETPNFVSHKIELPNTTGKLAFRARSANPNYKVQLRGVKLQTGSCTGPACLFEDKENTLSTCGWTLDKWNITHQLLPENVSGATSTGYFVYVIYPSIKATLTTTLVQSTGSKTGCLEFRYIICGSELRLLVSIQSLDGDRRAVWVVSSNTSTDDCLQTWQDAAVPLSSTSAYTVMFENVPTDKSSGVVAVDSVTYTTQPSSSACPLNPQHALPRDDDIISSLPTSTTQKLSGSISTMSGSISTVSGTISTVSESMGYKPATTTTFLQSTSSWLGDVAAVSSFTPFPQNMSENSNSDQTTPGVVSAVVIVIACIVAVVIIVIRKRRQKLEGAKIISDDTNGNANDVHYASEHPVVETILEDREDRAAILDPESDPYDVAEDGIPGITRSALSGNRGYILSPDDTARSCPISQKSPKQREGLPEMHSAVHNQQKGAPDLYSQVRKEKKKAQDVYSLVHKQKKEERNKSSGQGSTAGSLLNPSYTPEIYELANPQPILAMADTPDDQEYNALNFDIDRQVGESTHPREATGQTYDHLHGDVLYDCAKVEHNPHGVNMVIDAEYNHLV
ncbi:uncharacterized protein LOC112560347 [Pomacea canaliculata]|uniref:uncharacterized protein LOC112560347 n=1 Tax=Pomacea canaliculata TaxID=400727 RepID=UPI000D730470|nr:uncharacterized protein LOC112560347 [Pomacea canaliculata]